MINFIQPYDPAWKTEFEALKRVLECALNGMDVDVQHVGSTAVAGLVAKPILDIDVIVEDKYLLDAISSRLKKLGYLDKGEQGVPGRFAFRQSSDHTPVTANIKKWQAHHLYVCFSDAPALKNHLLFRDALLRDADLVKTYATLKTSLVAEKGMTREEYTRRKTEFILAVLEGLGLEPDELRQIKASNS